jgi:hypothetical protein
MDISEAQLSWAMSCALILAAGIGWPALTTAIALLREQRLLGRVYWHVLMELDRRRRP